jgi:predicted nucleic acid-binding protein
LVDTNVLSALRRKTPDPRVVQWFTHRPARSLYLSVLSLGEIRKGIEGVSDARRCTTLTDWLEVDLPTFFTGAFWLQMGLWLSAGGAWWPVKAKLGDHCQPLLPHWTVSWPPRPYITT